MNTSREWPVLGKTGLRDFSARDIGVVVVTYASASTIEACLFRLLAGRDVARVVVIDNASPDDTAAIVERLARRDARLGLVRNPENRGFAAACEWWTTLRSLY